VYINGGTFTLSGGKISNNANIGASTARGGGVYIKGGTFTMTGGEISGNTASASGGVDGGGLIVTAGGTFTMSGGEISGNTAIASSGSARGGGVWAGTFTKEPGGIIYGSDASDELKNTASGGTSHAVYAASNKKRNSTVEEGETLSNTAGDWVDHWTISFDADGGASSVQTARVDSGASLGASMPSDPTRDGYAFDGWYTEQNGGGDQFTAATTVTMAITVYAFWL
jgi:uncharacterized repeat protein (TIGR02543 family)